MAKISTKGFRSWKLWDYICQFIIVTGGVLLTLWLTGRITDSAKQREVRQAVQLVILELQDNLDVVEAYNKHIQEEKRIIQNLHRHGFSLSQFPKDTVNYYMKITSELGKPYHLSTDALEMFKTSGIATHISDKTQIIDLIRCYNSLALFDREIDMYVDQRKDALITAFYAGDPLPADPATEEYAGMFQKTLENKKVQNWLSMLSRSYSREYFEIIEAGITSTISRFQAIYNK